jgi:UDP:flavonoid glycosyltransferase YjiC (YdhE family)
MERKKILFVAEAVTLAHIGRALALAQTLDPQRYDVHFACADGYEFCFKDSAFTRWKIASVSSQQFLGALAAGKPVYDTATLASYVDDDLRLLDAVRPDLVVGDFRLSLSVSARLAKVPYVALINAYWSPYVRQHYTVPNIPLTRFLPIGIANALFRGARPIAFALHSVPLNRVRRRHGMQGLGVDLRRVYTDADQVLYADVPEMFAPLDMPASHAYLGPVNWSPPIVAPAWWDALPPDRPVVYVTLGSSGQGQLLPLVLDALAGLPVTVLAATAGNIRLDSVPANAYVADFLPGEAAAARSSLVICNGGSPTSHQALAAGVPLLGICSNLDQFLNMHGVAAAGAGMMLRADRFKPALVANAVKYVLSSDAASQAARKLASKFSAYDPGTRFQSAINKLLN